MYWYKIVDKDKKGNYKALFHGIEGSRIIPVGEWVKSEQKLVSDGSSGTKYKSGWHIMIDYDECQKYLSKFTAKTERVIVMVDVKGKIWPKEHSPSNVYLCEQIKIIGEKDISKQRKVFNLGNTFYLADKDLKAGRIFTVRDKLGKYKSLKNLKCPKCNKEATEDGHDPCLGALPGVRAACCGHGIDEIYGYIWFKNDIHISGHFTVEKLTPLSE